MTRFCIRSLACGLALGLAQFSPARADEADKAALAEKARGVFTTYCYKCHGLAGRAEGGFNVVVDLKKLVEMSFLDHQRSRVDRRSVRIKLTEKGCEVRDIVETLYQKHVRTVEQVGGINADEFAALNKSLHRLERFWTDQILYRL